MSWQAFEAGAPEMADFARAQFERSGMALVGTLRKDGSARISCVDPLILDGEILLGMMWHSRKALDLLRDPRILIHNAICTNRGDEGELTLRGRAAEVREPDARRRYLEAVETPWKEPHFHVFSVEVESAALVKYGVGRQSVSLWPRGTSFTRPYE